MSTELVRLDDAGKVAQSTRIQPPLSRDLWDDRHLMTRPESAENPGKLAVELAGHAYLWGGAVSIQAERVRNTPTPFERHVDGYFLVLAIRQVLRSAEAMH